MKKILIVSTVSRQFYLFEQGNIEVLKSLGYEVHAAANFSDANERLNSLDIIRHHFDIERSPFSLKNIKAYRQLKRLMKSEKFDAVHCHSPMGGVLARLAAKSVGIKNVVYTAHGFHFYKGSPLINWVLYYPVEKWLSGYTDVLITINKEDYQRGKTFNARKAVYVPGIGVNEDEYRNCVVDRYKKRKELGLPVDAYLILSVGELNKNKNHEVIIKALKTLNKDNVIYIVCGQGDREKYLKDMARKLGVSGNVKFLGFRNDLPEIYKTADLFAFPSFREGLSVSLMEAMASGLPVVCSDIRGNNDLIEDNSGGILIKPDDAQGFCHAITLLINEYEDLGVKMGLFNQERIKEFDKNNIKRKMYDIYVDFHKD